jgi:hypothetical protein
MPVLKLDFFSWSEDNFFYINGITSIHKLDLFLAYGLKQKGICMFFHTHLFHIIK